MSIEPVKIHILIIDNNFEETGEINTWLKQDMRVPWVTSHCISVEEARSRVGKCDLVILKPEMEGMSSPLDVFKNIEGMVFEVPILVLTNTEDDHTLSTFLMEQGAADTIIRGQFARLVDAIEFALIRQKLTTDARRASDRTLLDSQDVAKDALKKNTENNESDVERHKQILRMLGGDYSVEKQTKEIKKEI